MEILRYSNTQILRYRKHAHTLALTGTHTGALTHYPSWKIGQPRHFVWKILSFRSLLRYGSTVSALLTNSGLDSDWTQANWNGLQMFSAAVALEFFLLLFWLCPLPLPPLIPRPLLQIGDFIGIL